MDNITITIEMILAISGAISVIGGGTAVIFRMINPFKTLKEKVAKNEELLKKDNTRLMDIENSDKVICQCLLALLDHEITNNSIDKLKTARKNLQDYLIER